MRIVADWILHIAETEEVKLSLASTTGSVDGKQDGPRDATSYEANGNEEFEEAQIEIAVE